MTTLQIPGVETVHPRATWEPNGDPAQYGAWYANKVGDLRRDSAFHRRPPAIDMSRVEYLAVHWTSAINLPDGDPEEILAGDDGIRQLLARSTTDYLTNRTSGGYTRLADGKVFPGYPLGYNWPIDYLGAAWESGGFDYRDGATAGWNASVLSVLLLIDRADAATDEQWRTVREIAREANRRGARITPDRIWSHGWFRERTGIGTSTQCCGDVIEAQLLAGAADFIAHPDTPPDPIEPPEELMKHVKAGPFVMRMQGCNAVVYFDGAAARPVTPAEAKTSEMRPAVDHVIAHPMPFHAETASWLEAQGIDLART